MFGRIRKEYRFWRRRKRLIQFYNGFIESGDLCFDIGANVGNYTKVLINSGASVVAVEPQEDCATYIENKIRSENLYIEKVAISNTREELELNICNHNEVSTLSTEFMTYYKRYSYLDWDSTVVVRCITLDDLILKYGMPRYCKIDVEGYEYKVLSLYLIHI